MIKLSFEKKENFSFNEEEVDNSLNDYFQILLIPNKIENKNDLNESQVIEKIIDIFVGSLKSRLGPAPDTDQRLLLFNIIKYFVTKNIPINTFLTWGPKKFFAGTNEDNVDLSELLSIERLVDIDKKIKNIYSPGLTYIIYFEDFEGLFIEGNHLEKVFKKYIDGFENIINTLKLNKLIKVIRASKWITENFDINDINKQLNDNYIALKEYWYESEKLGIDLSENLISYKKINDIGWYGKIDNETRSYYMGRLDNMLGDTKSIDDKKDMTVRLLSCVLMHRQFKVFEFNNESECVKLSFLKISGGPKRLMNGRIDIRTIPTNVSKKHIAPWASNGCLKLKKNHVMPCLRTWQEIKREKSFKSSLNIMNDGKSISLQVLFLNN